MAERFERSLDVLRDRLDALGVEGGGVTRIVAPPEEVMRRILSGRIETEDADQAVLFVTECGDAILSMIGQAGSAAAMRAGIRTTVAQVLALGAIYGQEEET